MATLREISSHLNISQAVVSRVLNGKSDARASEETRRRIFEAARELNYRPSASARALATGRTMQLAVLSSRAERGAQGGGHYPDLRGLIDVAARYDYRVLVLPLDEGERAEEQLRNLIQDRVCDGICLYCDQVSEWHLRALRDNPVPCVVVGDMPEGERVTDNLPDAVSVDIDNYRYAYDSVAWLRGKGHRKIAYVRGMGEGNHPHCVALRSGYGDAMRAYAPDEEPLYLNYRQELPAIAEQQRRLGFTAVIVRDLYGALAWAMALQAAGLELPRDCTIMAQMSTVEYRSLVMGGWGDLLACHLHERRHCGWLAGEILMKWAAGEAPRERTHLVRAIAPDWCGALESVLNADIAELDGGN